MSIEELKEHFLEKMNELILPEYRGENGRGYNYQGCADALNEFFETNEYITRHNVENFFAGRFDRANALWIMLGLLQIHKIPYSSIFPAINAEQLLNDDGYFQTYHGIMYPRNSTLNKVENLRFFTLTITRGTGFKSPSATLSYRNEGDKNRQPENRQFEGTPVLSPRNDIISILFHDKNPRAGTFFHFYFSYHMVNATNLRFKRGFVVTTLSNRQMAEIPIVLNFIMFNWPLGLETVQNHPGLETLLQYANLSVYVPAEEFHAILAKFTDVSYLFESDHPLTAVERKDLCVIDEPKILADIQRISSREDRMKAYYCLLELKQNSLSPTHITWETLYDDLFGTIMGIQ